MTISCQNCSSTNIKKNGKRVVGDVTVQRFRCRDCGNQTSSNTANYNSVEVRPKTGERYVITSFTPGVNVHPGFKSVLLAYCSINNAKLLLLPTKHKSIDLNFDDDLSPFILNENLVFENQKIKVMATLNLQTSLEIPLSGLDPLSKGYSLIVGHPQVQLRTLPRLNELYPAIVTTTGSISERAYKETKQGAKSNFNHSLSAVVLELGEGDEFFVRHLNFDEETSSFHDLNEKYTASGMTHSKVTALVTGDEHVQHSDLSVVGATYSNSDSLSKILKPQFIVRHDVFDGHSISHHHARNTLLQYQKFNDASNRVEDELNKTVQFINNTTPEDSISFIVQSNHNEHLQQWLNSCDPKVEPWNAKIFHELMFRSLDAIDKKEGIPDTFELFATPRLNKNVLFVDRNEGYTIHGVTIGAHGDVGVNGSRGSRKQFAALPTKTVIGHSHSPGIERGCYQTGTSSKLRLEYNKGPSSWHHAHCIIHVNGKRQLIFIRNGKYRV